MKYRYFLFFIFLLPLQFSLATIYMVNTDGHQQFSDKPSPGADILTLEKINYISTSGAENKMISENSTKANVYTNLDLLQPQNQQTFQNQQQISVEIFIQPELRKEDSLELWLDGSLHQKSRDTHFLLSQLTRGEHQLEVHVVNTQGKTLLQSSPVVFFVHFAVVK